MVLYDRIDIAILDDDPLHRTLLRKLLEADGYAISIEEKTGEDFLERMKSIIPLPHVCIVDIFLPGMDGFETIKQVKDGWPTVKVIAYTGLVEPTTFEKAIDAGADLLMLKGEHPKKMIRTIEGLIEDWKESDDRSYLL
ncbi:response regulator [Olivibacter domesticus]|uniref:Response regulator receiver domain-containing protein n=1 Tax=Olivibacter domesticus TaxID=407022 RepID=A0A1H7TAU7_OLID1|nr:response regulator transcription factor [Olivibacter domesticus]SEL81416.1 Response regulator receiver domain-containing protein [Olivibacter domesticus]